MLAGKRQTGVPACPLSGSAKPIWLSLHNERRHEIHAKRLGKQSRLMLTITLARRGKSLADSYTTQAGGQRGSQARLNVDSPSERSKIGSFVEPVWLVASSAARSLPPPRITDYDGQDDDGHHNRYSDEFIRTICVLNRQIGLTFGLRGIRRQRQHDAASSARCGLVSETTCSRSSLVEAAWSSLDN